MDWLQEEIRVIEHISYYSHVFVENWLDIIWIPIAAISVNPGQRLKAVGFVILCMTVMRLQIDIIHSFGFKTGFTGFWDASLYHRGLLTYSIFIMIYLLLSYFSPYTRGVIYLAASISIFFMAFAVSSFVMAI
jgi:hypothetical protein